MLNKNRPILCIAFLAVALLSISNATQVSPISPSESYRFQINNFKYNDLHIGKKYNYFQTDQRIFMMDSNVTIANFVEISIPDIIFAQQNCTKFTFHSAELYSISACKDLSDNTTYLVMTSFLSSRPFYAYSLKTDLKEVVSMKLSGSVLVVEDQAGTTGVSSKTHLFRVNLGGSITSKAMELIAHTDAQTLGEVEVAVKEFVTQQSSLRSYGERFEGKTFAIDCSQNASFCKAFVSNSAQNSIDVYRVERIYSLSISRSSSAAVNLPNTTFREWFVLFLVILGCLAVLARCTSKKNGNTESEIAREQVVTVVESSSTTNYRLVDNKDASLVSTPIARA